MYQKPKTDWKAHLVTLGIISATIGCSSPKVSLEPTLQLNPSFQSQGDLLLPDKWWDALDAPALNDHIETALAGNFTLQAAWQRLKTAEALLKRTSADTLPSLDGDANLAYRDSDSNDGRVLGSLGLAASYEIDLWGRIEAQVDAQRFNREVAFENMQTAALSISSEVALAWLSLVEAQQRKALLENQIEINASIEEVLLARFSAGQIDSADVLRQRQLIESTRQQLFNAEQRIRIAFNQLNVLKGLAPGVGPDGEISILPTLPALPDPGIPSELIEKRPDVRAAYFELFADNSELAAAVANQYPRFDISGSFSTSSSSIDGLFETWSASVIGQVAAPLFDGGARRSEVERRAAIVKEKVATYSQTILEACQEVEDALVVEQSQGQIFDSLRRELELNEQSSGQLRARYLNGATDYLSVLTNLRDGQQLQRDILSAQLNLLNNRIGLYRALAGNIGYINLEG